jgi:chromosome segregation ATPase
LVRTEVKVLSGRLSQISEELTAISVNFGAVLLEAEDQAKKVEALQNGLEFSRSEIIEIKRQLAAQQELLTALQNQLDALLSSGPRQ